MAILEILTYPNPILKKACAPVTDVNDELRKFLDDMLETMYQNAGIGLAAIQVGRLIRAIVVDIREDERGSSESKVHKLINPEILEKEGSKKCEEGCLSVPGVREEVIRAEKIKVRALNENGKKVEFIAEGLLAICIQHEIDHLDGILFVDRLSKLRRTMIKKKLNKLT
ncbi:MAG: peptide deformylase [Deltaproteobacteria bacterium]|nr:peptide deformylase [Deltaproteobacteria bacterium]